MFNRREKILSSEESTADLAKQGVSKLSERILAKLISEGLTFDDVLLVPAYSKTLPGDVDISANLTRDISLNIPIVSAAMDTVTEAKLAIALAREGGIGVVHKNMSPERQADEVDKVKRSESGMIVDPITLSPDKSISDALKVMTQFSVSGIPIVAEQGKLVGILTNRDLRFLKDHSLKVSDVMTSENLVTVPEGTDLDTAQEILHKHRIEKLLIVDDQFHLKGMITVKDIMKKIQYPNACKDKRGRLRVAAAVGVSADTDKRIELLTGAGVDAIVVDSSHGHSKGILEVVERVKRKYPEVGVIAGNIATSDGAKAIIDAGADAVKVGIGPGSICTTRIITGCGVPQLTAVMDAAEVAESSGIPVIADGGIRFSGDIVKALAAGASCVMVGSIFAGCEETPGETVLFEGRSFKVYRGMGSVGAMKEGSADRYFQDRTDDHSKFVPEGVEGRTPFKGPLADSIYQLIGGIRSGMGLCGAENIETLQEKGKFVRITSAGIQESHPHSVPITKEPPNYRPLG
ncbi:MAG: IMP dehydrogenase [candidate division Zixibacteria bacterium]|nr:IMP dehydrogenase [candidate division Zixibacteria bacterium]